MDDRAEGLWRIHDQLYDFTRFIDQHPGGETWLRVTKGTDITEAFESHHLTQHPERMLPNYLVRKAARPRLYRFTFAEDGFYKTLKRRVAERMKTVDRSATNSTKVQYLGVRSLNEGLIDESFLRGSLTHCWPSH